MKQFVLSPCGTSLLTNGSTSQERSLISQYANTKKLGEIPDEDFKILERRIKNVREKMKDVNALTATKLSAELNAIVKLYHGCIHASQDYHLLLCTDTWLGEQTATLVAEWLRQNQVTVEIKRQPDLQTASLPAFQLALSDLVLWCQQILMDYRDAHYHIVFNLTAGFKSVQGFLQTLAMFYADESIYVFETGRELLRIPRLPVKMSAEETVKTHLSQFRRMALGLPVKDVGDIPETLLIRIDNETTLSAWGTLVWEQTRKTIYREQIFPVPIEQLQFGQGFERSVSALAPERKVLVNERLDQLTRYIHTHGDFNPPSLDMKALQGKPKPPSTHELDAWADQDAKRIFGHYQKDIFVLDKLDKALH